jgi:hypothetical protein
MFQRCFNHCEIHAVDLYLRKSPVRSDGTLGVQVSLTRAEFENLNSTEI